MGDFQGKEFMQALSEMDYKGLITMEIYYPGVVSVSPYDFEVIKKSVDFLREN